MLGALLVVQAHRLLSRSKAGVTGAQLKTMNFFHLTNAYLALLFVAVTVDPLLVRFLA